MEKTTVGTVWEDREDGAQWEVAGAKDGRVQISPVGGGDYRIMSEKSLRSNYKLVAMKAEESIDIIAPVTDASANKLVAKLEAENKDTNPEHIRVRKETAERKAQAQLTEGTKERAPKGRVKLADGRIIPGAHFIIEVCGQTRDATYKVDSPIRWLLKPAGQALLKGKGATIVFGEAITK